MMCWRADSLPLSLRVKTSTKEDSFCPSDLLAQFKQVGIGTRAHIRAAELLDNTVEVIREMVYTHSMAQLEHTGIGVHTNTQRFTESRAVFDCFSP